MVYPHVQFHMQLWGMQYPLFPSISHVPIYLLLTKLDLVERLIRLAPSGGIISQFLGRPRDGSGIQTVQLEDQRLMHRRAEG